MAGFARPEVGLIIFLIFNLEIVKSENLVQ